MDPSIKFTSDPEAALSGADAVVLGVGTQATRSVLENLRDFIPPEAVLINVSKGLEFSTGKRISAISEEICPKNPYTVLSGPSHAEEVALGLPTTVVTSSTDLKRAEYVQNIFMNGNFRVYTNPDLIGVEIGGALKNIIALGAGINDGLGFGDNTKAALMTRGIYEISKLGIALGGHEATFFGLSGVGDLIVTCTSMHSRNRRCGILIGEGKTLEEAVSTIGMLVEGVETTRAAALYSKKIGVEMPITRELYRVLFEKGDIADTVAILMERDKKIEMESLLDL